MFSTDLCFRLRNQQTEEHFFRHGQTSVQIYLDWTQQPYAFFAFANCGNSGLSVWFKSKKKNAILRAEKKPRLVPSRNHGNAIAIDLKAKTQSLVIEEFLLGSMRFIRDQELGVSVPPEMLTHTIRYDGRQLVVEKQSLNQKDRYRFIIQPLGRTRLKMTAEKKWSLEALTSVRFRLLGSTTERGLKPFAMQNFFKKQFLKKMDRDLLTAFSYLVYQEMLFAGSPRYQNKFGRDTLITLYALMSTMKPKAIEAVLLSQVATIQPRVGMVSHEETGGDYASFVRSKHHQKYIGIETPLEDYKMLDDDFLFVLAVARFLELCPERAKIFLKRRSFGDKPVYQLIQSNFLHVIRLTQPFVKNPIFKNLIRLKEGEVVGNWRDSADGLGGGLFPFDVNAALVPGALLALARLYSDHHSQFFDPQRSRKMYEAFEVWNTRVLPLFEVKLNKEAVVPMAMRYWQKKDRNLRHLPKAPDQDLVFSAIALDGRGQPIPVMHSDDSLMLVFGQPSLSYLEATCNRILAEFPYGLRTDQGILVANAVFASLRVQKKFDGRRYHGENVSWGMQENLLDIGLNHALHRSDLSNELRRKLQRAKRLVEKIILAKQNMSGTEVFEIIFRNGKFIAIPFNVGADPSTGGAKTNHVQLWSFLRLGQTQ